MANNKDEIPKWYAAQNPADSGPPTERINIDQTQKNKPSQITIELINRYTPTNKANNQEASKMEEILNDTLEDIGLK